MPAPSQGGQPRCRATTPFTARTLKRPNVSEISLVFYPSESLVGGKLKLSELLLREGSHSSIESVLWNSPHLERESYRVFREAFLRRGLYDRSPCQVGAIQVGRQGYHEN